MASIVGFLSQIERATRDEMQIWCTNAAAAGGTIAVSAMMANGIEAMVDRAVSPDGIGFGVGNVMFLGSWYLQHRLPHTHDLAIHLGELAGLTAYTLLPISDSPAAWAISTAVSAVVAGNLATMGIRNYT